MNKDYRGQRGLCLFGQPGTREFNGEAICPRCRSIELRTLGKERKTQLRQDAFSDVKRACAKWLRERKIA